MILIIIIIVGLIGFYAIKQTIENKLLNDKLRVQPRIYENYIYSLKIQIVALQEDKNIYSRFQKERVVYRNAAMPDGVLDAVKIAMKVSHPDNGGKTADFIKYNELYKKLSK